MCKWELVTGQGCLFTVAGNVKPAYELFPNHAEIWLNDVNCPQKHRTGRYCLDPRYPPSQQEMWNRAFGDGGLGHYQIPERNWLDQDGLMVNENRCHICRRKTPMDVLRERAG